jgi:hypothetical protein
MKRRPEKKKGAGCPQWILDGVKAARTEATRRSVLLPLPEPTTENNFSKIRDG